MDVEGVKGMDTWLELYSLYSFTNRVILSLLPRPAHSKRSLEMKWDIVMLDICPKFEEMFSWTINIVQSQNKNLVIHKIPYKEVI